jgi:hypothetical protein
MRIPDGAHTHGHGGGGLGTAVLVIVGAALAVKYAGTVAAAAAGLVSLVLWAVAIVAGLAVTSGATYAIYRWRHPRREPPLQAQATVIRPQPRHLPHEPPAIGRPSELHLHFHGVTPDEVAAIIRREQEQP